ncbi:MAG: histidinol-phosphate transaminase [Thermoleophilia bacterium]
MDEPTPLTSLARPALAGVAAYEPGRPIEDVRRELGLDRIVKLASNEGPYPPFPAAVEAIRGAAEGLRLYPDPGAWALRDALSGHLGVPADRILPGNGVDSLIKLMCLALLDPGDELVMGWPSFISWRQGADTMGATVRTAPPGADGAYDLDALAALVGPATKLVVVVSPNNPTGGAVGADALAAFLDALPGHVLPVLDEAYFEYLPPGGHDGVALVRAGRRLVVTRTFSKAYGLAGARIGYMVAPPELLAELGKVRNAFDVNALAQAAAVASLRDGVRLLPARMAEVAAERARVDAGLRALGLAPVPSTANFVLVPVGGAERAGRLNTALLSHGVIVRPAGPFGAPDALRITIGLPEENTALLDAMAAVVADPGNA